MSYLSYLKEVTLGAVLNHRRIWYLAKFEYLRANKDLFLGNLWKLLYPCIQIGAYWLVFGLGIRQGRDIDGIPFIVWLTCGVAPWFIANQCVSIGASSIYRKAVLLSKSNISTVLIPVSAVLSTIMNHVWTVLVLFFIFIGNGCPMTWYILNVLYYFFFVFVFSSALSMVTSVLVMLARDFQRIIPMIMRFFFFLTPIFWIPNGSMPAAYHVFDWLNPFAYLVKGFRDSMLYHASFWQKPAQVAYFWALTFVLYLIGVKMHQKLRSSILDYL